MSGENYLRQIVSRQKQGIKKDGACFIQRKKPHRKSADGVAEYGYCASERYDSEVFCPQEGFIHNVVCGGNPLPSLFWRRQRKMRIAEI